LKLIDRYLSADEDSFEALRQKRKLMLQKKMRQEQDWRQLGHGRYSEVTDTKEFFNTCKKSSKVICHFYRRTTPRCEIVDAHFERLAQEHVEARFIKIEAEKNPFLVERLGVILMPTIVLIKDGKTDHAIHGFDEFGGTDDFSTADVGYVLAHHGMIVMEVDRSEEIGASASRAGLNHIRMNRIRAGEYDDIDIDCDDV
jgi:thiol-disulfide isomerase/thioredoxin